MIRFMIRLLNDDKIDDDDDDGDDDKIVDDYDDDDYGNNCDKNIHYTKYSKAIKVCKDSSDSISYLIFFISAKLRC